jgi:tetratricopeptide (TPR) repeat protein
MCTYSTFYIGRDNMPVKNRIKSLFKEADTYRTQGLFAQSKEKYRELLDLIKGSGEPEDHQLLDSVEQRISSVDSALDEIEKAPEAPELSEETQKLISNLFSFSKNKEISEIEGAVALAKFGQYEKALAEFQRLINEGIFPMMAAKNMLRCQLMFSSPETAVAQYNKWASRTLFTKGELLDLKEFLENMLKKDGFSMDLSGSVTTSSAKENQGERMEDVLEISSIRTRLDQGPRKGMEVDFDVTFQLGNTVSFIVRGNRKYLIDALRPGIQLSRVQCYSPLSLFNARGIVSSKERIKRGPKKGDFSFDLTVEEA